MSTEAVIPPPLRILALTPDPALFQWLVEDLAADPAAEPDSYHFALSGTSFRLQAAFEASQVNPAEADMILGLVHFVDVVSLTVLNELLKQSVGSTRLPTAVLVYRKENEKDFKMSCPFCGQKIWVRDADQDKRGRCPNCHKGFTLPEQEEHVTGVLQLAKEIPVQRVVRGNPSSFSAPLKQLLRIRADLVTLRVAGDSLFRSSGETMNVAVDTDTGEIPG